MTFKCVTWRWCKIVGLFCLEVAQNFCLLPGLLIFGLGEEQQCSLPTKSRKKKPISKMERVFNDGVTGSGYWILLEQKTSCGLFVQFVCSIPKFCFCAWHIQVYSNKRQSCHVVVSERGSYWNLGRSSGWIAWGKQSKKMRCSRGNKSRDFRRAIFKPAASIESLVMNSVRFS